ncbi:MAG: T9SS type A sorting domain-containing protein [Cyclobacteriaceae bacterium]
MKNYLFALLTFLLIIPCDAQHSVARNWNETLLEAIRGDFARPTVHARNLFHVSAAMYDSWAILSAGDEPYLIGNEVQGFTSVFNGFTPVAGEPDDIRAKAISYAAYRLIEHRFANSPGVIETMEIADQLFVDELGFDPSFISTDYSTGSAAALGNFVADQYIQYGLQDGSNEQGDYENIFYLPENDPLDAESPGNPNLTDPNRWQPLAFDVFIDQSGNPIPGAIPDFLSPEWGQVAPFSLTAADLTIENKDGNDYYVYHNPGPPPYLDPQNGTGFSDEYRWGFSMVAVWSGHLDYTQDAIIDISPGALGNINIDDLPVSISDYDQFYDYLAGGDPGTGYTMNPKTGLPYTSQVVKLGDYGRVLAEFWADGPDSETPPGHWFTILNYVNDHPEFEKKFGGTGETLSDLEWDIKAYFIMGGTMHDVAITAWGLKGYYDYIRPVSAIRYMADMGQSTDPGLPNYHIAGIPLVDGHIELVESGDPLAGSGNENLNKIKLWAWRGPDFISDPETDVAGVGWILAENWWPYQRPSFITPPFAGYISGHSTYSRAAAEVMTLLTGDAYFPGGIGEFEAPMNEFLVFEDGPSEDITLQWATYRDASDQCSLSRIWGGIHPPADDLPGRIIGETIGEEAFEFAAAYFSPVITGLRKDRIELKAYPNPTTNLLKVTLTKELSSYNVQLLDLSGKIMLDKTEKNSQFDVDMTNLPAGSYILRIFSNDWQKQRIILVK